VNIPSADFIWVRLELESPIRLPVYPGSELRGILKQGLQRLGFWPAQEHLPAPFTISAPRWPGAGWVELPSHLEFGIRFFPGLDDALDFLTLALEQIGEHRWLGRGRRSRFRAKLKQLKGPEELAEELGARAQALRGQRLRLRTQSPVALRRGRKGLAGPEAGAQLLKSVNDRCEKLLKQYQRPLSVALSEGAGGDLSISAHQVYWSQLPRRGRGGSRHPLSGWEGWVEYDPPSEAQLNTLIIGEALGAGRWTPYGLGQYRLERR